MKHIVYSHAKGVAAGLRPSARLAQSLPALVKLIGMFPDQQCLNTHEPFTLLDLAAELETCTFPYPQIHVGGMVTLIATPTRLYDFSNGVVTLVLSGATSGNRWTFADFQNYVLATNGATTAVRHPTTHTWEIDNLAIPPCNVVLALNGQVIVGGVYDP